MASPSLNTADEVDSPLPEPDRATCSAPADACELTQDQGFSGEEPHPLDLAEIIQGDYDDESHDVLDQEPASSRAAGLNPVKKASDPRLQGLDISFWTKVPVTDVFATDAISSYLRSDHRIWELFDADTFLSDLVSQKSDFCSPFLVNCLLAFASVCGPLSPGPRPLQAPEEPGLTRLQANLCH